MHAQVAPKAGIGRSGLQRVRQQRKGFGERGQPVFEGGLALRVAPSDRRLGLRVRHGTLAAQGAASQGS